jgi:hypothetical protein
MSESDAKTARLDPSGQDLGDEYPLSANGGFRLRIEIDVVIPDEGWWPLGENHPGRVPTAADAAEVARRYASTRGWGSLIREWCLEYDVSADVDGEIVEARS